MVRKIKRRNPTGDSWPPIDREAIRKGTIPWTVDDVFAVFEFMAKLHETPHDDWDRTPHRFRLRGADNTVTQYQFNTDMPMNQAMGFVVTRCREQNLDETTRMSHGMRFFAVLDFLRENDEKLRECGLILDGETPQQALLSPHLMEVLATSPYTRATGEKTTHGIVLDFDPDDVIIEAGLRQKAEENETGENGELEG